MRRSLSILGLLAGLAAGAGASGADGPGHVTPADAELAVSAERWLTRQFALDKSLTLDDGLRSAGLTVAAEHLARVRPLLRARIAEERALVGPQNSKFDISWRIMAWLINELALWRLQALDEEQRELDGELLAQPGLCRATGLASPFGEQLSRLQQLPASRWTAALDAERRRLAHWGMPRPDLPERPSTVADRQLAAAIAEAKNGRPTTLPMPPILARNVVAQTWPSTSARVMCVAHQWWTRSQLLADPAKAADLRWAFAYATTPDVGSLFSKWSSRPSAPSDEPDAYPASAAEFDVTARISVEIRFDATGKVTSADVVQRDVKVPGVRGVRPVAFETLFDNASLARARLRVSTRSESSRPTDRRGLERVEFVWSMK